MEITQNDLLNGGGDCSHSTIRMPASMRTLAIVEVLERVCSYNDNATNASAARVCRAWSDVALMRLWSCIDDVEALVGTLAPLHEPPGSSSLVFASRFGARSWDRFIYYCKHVQLFHFEPSFGTDTGMKSVSISVFEEIARTRPPRVLMPRLKHLSFAVAQYTDNAHLPYAVLFFHDKLRSFTLKRDSANRTFTEADLNLLFRDISTGAPNLSVLHLHLDLQNFIKQYNERAFAGFLSTLSNLEHLHVSHPLTPLVKQELSKLTKLRFVIFGNNCQEIPLKYWRQTSSSKLQNFGSLHTLGLEGTLDEVLQGLTGGFRPEHLCRLFLQANGSFTREKLQSILTNSHALAQQAQDLRTFEWSCQPTSPTDFTPHIHLAQTLSSIVKWSKLVTLRLHFYDPISMSNDDVERFASELPNLKYFWMQCISVAPPEVSPTLEVLPRLGHACPKLQALEIYVDATSARSLPVEIPSSSNNSFSKLRTLYLERSPIDESGVVEVASFLGQILPSESVLKCRSKLTKKALAFTPGDSNQAFSVAMTRYGLWQKVKDALPTLLRVQKAHRAAIDKLQLQVEDLRRRESETFAYRDVSFIC